jgi:hypothetical protein
MNLYGHRFPDQDEALSRSLDEMQRKARAGALAASSRPEVVSLKKESA